MLRKSTYLLLILFLSRGLSAMDPFEDDGLGQPDPKAKYCLKNYLASKDSPDDDDMQFLQYAADSNENYDIGESNPKAKLQLGAYVKVKGFTDLEIGFEVKREGVVKESIIDDINISFYNVVTYSKVLDESDARKVLECILSLKKYDMDLHACPPTAKLKLNIGGLRSLGQALPTLNRPLLKKLVVKTQGIGVESAKAYQDSYEEAFTVLVNTLMENYYLTSLHLDMTDLPSDFIKFSVGALVIKLSSNDVLQEIILEGPISRASIIGCSFLLQKNAIITALKIITSIVFDSQSLTGFFDSFELTISGKEILLTRKDGKKKKRGSSSGRKGLMAVKNINRATKNS